MTANKAMIITFSPQPENADAFAKVLERALPLVRTESGTLVWLAGRSDTEPATFFLIDLFESQEAQAAHLAGQAAALVLGEGGTLLAEPPVVSAFSIVAAKVGAA